ncbi:hypothetical protein IFM89_026428 [Coptis chinensis]|uniref:Uncharacterized protein n=1 Tax=Coptis chinensis TaxID=261450 RepID=A0A835HMF1_9MAGN|nr:hypothetical protein IFM89_026428 [Coptis chinensis]
MMKSVFLESLSEGVATSHLDRRDEDYKEDRTGVQARPDTIAPLAGFGALMEKKMDLIYAIIEEHAGLIEAINEIVEKKKAMKKKKAMDESQAMVESR